MLGPKIHAEVRKVLAKPMLLISGPLMNSPLSSPAFIKLMSIENCNALIFLLVISIDVARSTVKSPPLRKPIHA